MDKDEVVISGPLRRIIKKGGPGSGHFDHKGRPGEVGGSLPSDAATLTRPEVIEEEHGTFYPSFEGMKPYKNRPAWADRKWQVDYMQEGDSIGMGVGWRTQSQEFEDNVQEVIDDYNVPFDHTDMLTFSDELPDADTEYTEGDLDWRAYIDKNDGHRFAGRYINYVVYMARLRYSPAIILHEIGHHVDKIYGMSNSWDWRTGYRKFMDDTQGLKEHVVIQRTGLRYYSQTNRREFFADVYKMMMSGVAEEEHLSQIMLYIGKDAYAEMSQLVSEEPKPNE
jgi:hypothetical protein